MFDRVFCINLDRRPKRWEQFCSQFDDAWPWRCPERWPAVEGERPRGYLASNGAWGCWQSHMAIWREQVAKGWDSVLVFEDDAVLCLDVVDRMRACIERLPESWDQVYFGGQHLRTTEFPPHQVNDCVLRGHYINRTHCYAIRRKFAEVCLREIAGINDTKDERLHHVDHRLCQLHLSGEYEIFCPIRFCVAQGRGKSDVTGRRVREHWWNQFPYESPVTC